MSVDLTVALRNYCAYWQNLSAATVAEITTIATENFVFSDPFHQLKNRADFIAMLHATMAKNKNLQFIVHHQQLNGNAAEITWTCLAQRRVWRWPVKIHIEGSSTVMFDAVTGLATSHVDHWQPWQELLVKPALRAVGGLGAIRVIQR